MHLSVFIPIDPLPQPRPRFARTGHCYEPAKITEYKRVIGQFVKVAMINAGEQKAEKGEPLSLSCEFAFQIPKSWTKRRREEAECCRVPHVSRPDLDNLVKAVKDALNGVVWADDCQVASYGYLRKIYDLNPGIRLEVHSHEAPES